MLNKVDPNTIDNNLLRSLTGETVKGVFFSTVNTQWIIFESGYAVVHDHRTIAQFYLKTPQEVRDALDEKKRELERVKAEYTYLEAFDI